MNYIPRSDYIEYIDNINDGEQIKVNHTNCTAGEDTRSRLYIKRSEDDARIILVYCHNCGLSGSYRETKFRYHGTKKDNVHAQSVHSTTNTGGQGSGGHTIPKSRAKLSDWSTERRLWLSRYGITAEEVEQYKLQYDEETGGIVLPVYRGDELEGWQVRSFIEGKPKYVTRAYRKPLWWYSGDYTSATALQSLPEAHPVQLDTTRGIAIVEDMLSGIKCARHIPTIALLGANMHDKIIAFAIDKNKSNKFVLFLDDDNRQIKLNQLRIKRNLEQLGYTVQVVTGIGKDPKSCSNKELKEILL